jgi:hypothetical protein
VVGEHHSLGIAAGKQASGLWSTQRMAVDSTVSFISLGL